MNSLLKAIKNKITGTSVVDNENDPSSALSKVRRYAAAPKFKGSPGSVGKPSKLSGTPFNKVEK